MQLLKTRSQGNSPSQEVAIPRPSQNHPALMRCKKQLQNVWNLMRSTVNLFPGLPWPRGRSPCPNRWAFWHVATLKRIRGDLNQRLSTEAVTSTFCESGPRALPRNLTYNLLSESPHISLIGRHSTCPHSWINPAATVRSITVPRTL